MKKEFTVAILGATGLVGQRMIKQLEQSTIPVKKVKFLASKRSAGKKLKCFCLKLLRGAVFALIILVHLEWILMFH